MLFTNPLQPYQNTFPKISQHLPDGAHLTWRCLPEQEFETLAILSTLWNTWATLEKAARQESSCGRKGADIRSDGARILYFYDPACRSVTHQW